MSAIPLSRANELNAIGAQLFTRGELEPARLHFLGALMLEPQHQLALQNLGTVLRNLGHNAAAASVARRSVALSPNNAFALSNLGVSHLSKKEYAASEQALRKAVGIAPEVPSLWHNFGLVLYMRGKHLEALTAFDRSLELHADNDQCRSDRALTFLALGFIQEGLEAYEARWKILAKSSIWELGIAEWHGEPLLGRTILVHHEQGFGDGLMLSRFLIPLAKLGADITVAVPTELVRLFRQNFGRIAQIKDRQNTEFFGAAYDYHSPFLSLVRWLGIKETADISSVPYLTALGAKDGVNLPQAKLRVGICWASGDHGRATAERRRLIPVTDFLPLTEIVGVSVVSLQKSSESKDLIANGMEGLVFDVSHKLESFADTAEVISALDVVISVDSAVAHLAGAMGKPVIMLSPYTRCWRWWDAKMGETGLPWYQDMVVLSQDEDGTWEDAIDEAVENVRLRLEALC